MGSLSSSTQLKTTMKFLVLASCVALSAAQYGLVGHPNGAIVPVDEPAVAAARADHFAAGGGRGSLGYAGVGYAAAAPAIAAAPVYAAGYGYAGPLNLNTTWLATPTVLLSPLMSQLLLPPVPTTSPPGMPSTLPLLLLLSLPLPLLLPPSPPPSPPSQLLATATPAPSTSTPTSSPTPTEPLFPLTSPLLPPPVPITSLLVVDFTLEPLLDLTATEPDTVTAWWPTPTALLSPWTSPLFRPRVPTTSLPRELSTREPRKSLLFIV